MVGLKKYFTQTVDSRSGGSRSVNATRTKQNKKKHTKKWGRVDGLLGLCFAVTLLCFYIVTASAVTSIIQINHTIENISTVIYLGSFLSILSEMHRANNSGVGVSETEGG